MTIAKNPAPPRVLSIIAPMTQLNTPYPSTAYLTGFLRSRGVDAVQEDLALALVLELLSPKGLRAVRDVIDAMPRAAAHAGGRGIRRAASIAISPRSRRRSPSCRAATRRWRTASHAARSCPKGRAFARWTGMSTSPTTARRPAGLGLRRAGRAGPRAPPRHAVPQRHRRRAARRGGPALRVRALRREPGAEPAQLRPAGRSAGRSAQPGRSHLAGADAGRGRAPPTDAGAGVGAVPRVRCTRPSASRRRSRPHDPGIVTALGGGFVNTELRELAEPRVFDHFDFVTLDAGERPLLALIEHLQGRRSQQRLVRTFTRDAATQQVRLHRTWPSPTSPSTRSARRPGTACRSTAICRCWTCSTRCTGCGPTGAGTSSPWPMAATGRSAASAT